MSGQTSSIDGCIEAVHFGVELGATRLDGIMILIEEANQERDVFIKRFPRQIYRGFDKSKSSGQERMSDISMYNCIVEINGVAIPMQR